MFGLRLLFYVKIATVLAKKILNLNKQVITMQLNNWKWHWKWSTAEKHFQRRRVLVTVLYTVELIHDYVFIQFTK